MTIPSLPLSSQLHDCTKFATRLHDHTKFATQLHDNAKFDYKRLCGSEAIQINIHWHFKPLLWPWLQQFKFGCKKISTSENVPETVIFWLWITYCNFQTTTVRHCWILGAESHTHGTLEYKAQLWQCHSRWGKSSWTHLYAKHKSKCHNMEKWKHSVNLKVNFWGCVDCLENITDQFARVHNFCSSLLIRKPAWIQNNHYHSLEKHACLYPISHTDFISHSKCTQRKVQRNP